MEELAAAAGAGSLGVVEHLAELGAGGLAAPVGSDISSMKWVCLAASPVLKRREAIGGRALAGAERGGRPVFSVVALDVLGEIVVDDPADVGFVDAHAEGDGGADDAGCRRGGRDSWFC